MAVAAVFVVAPVVVVVVAFVVEVGVDKEDVASPAGCVLEPSPTNDNGEEDLSEDREERASSDLSSARLLNAVAVVAAAAAAAVVAAVVVAAVPPPKYPPSPPPVPAPAPAPVPAPVPPTPPALDEYPALAARTRLGEYCCMSPLNEGSDRSLASFSLAGGTWDPISSDTTFDLSSSGTIRFF